MYIYHLIFHGIYFCKSALLKNIKITMAIYMLGELAKYKLAIYDNSKMLIQWILIMSSVCGYNATLKLSSY